MAIRMLLPSKTIEDPSVYDPEANTLFRGDGTKLFKDWGVACSSMVELGAIAIQVQDDLSNPRIVRSMETLTRELVGSTKKHWT